MTPLARYIKAQKELKEAQNAFYEWVREEKKTKSPKVLATETGLSTQRIFQIVHGGR